jgi:hypothetical protein
VCGASKLTILPLLLLLSFFSSSSPKDPELEDYLNKFDKYSASLSSVNKEGDALYTLLNKISSKSEGFLCSMLEVQSLVHPPDQPEELEEHKAADGMANGCRAYASVFLATFMQVVNKSVAEQKVKLKRHHLPRRCHYDNVFQSEMTVIIQSRSSANGTDIP